MIEPTLESVHLNVLQVVETADLEFLETSGAMYNLLKNEIAALSPDRESLAGLALFDASLLSKLKILKKSD